MKRLILCSLIPLVFCLIGAAWLRFEYAREVRSWENKKGPLSFAALKEMRKDPATNGALLYKRAAMQFIQVTRRSSPNYTWNLKPEDISLYRDIINQNSKTLELLDQASALPVVFPYDLFNENVYTLRLDHLQNMAQFNLLRMSQIQMALQQEKFSEAVAAVGKMKALQRAMEKDYLSYAQSVRMQNFHTMFHAGQLCLRTGRLNPTQLEDLQSHFSEVSFFPALKPTILSHAYQVIRLEKNPNPLFFMGAPNGSSFSIFAFQFTGFFKRDATYALRKIEKLLEMDLEKKARESTELEWPGPVPEILILSNQEFYNLSRLWDMCLQGEMKVLLMQTACDLELFRLKTGQYPGLLTELPRPKKPLHQGLWNRLSYVQTPTGFWLFDKKSGDIDRSGATGNDRAPVVFVGEHPVTR